MLRTHLPALSSYSIMKHLVLLLLQALTLSEAFFNGDVKYMPLGYNKKSKCPDIPAKVKTVVEFMRKNVKIFFQMN